MFAHENAAMGLPQLNGSILWYAVLLKFCFVLKSLTKFDEFSSLFTLMLMAKDSSEVDDQLTKRMDGEAPALVESAGASLNLLHS